MILKLGKQGLHVRLGKQGFLKVKTWVSESEPENLIGGLLKTKVDNLAVINAGMDTFSWDCCCNKLFMRMISYVGENAEFERQFLHGDSTKLFARFCHQDKHKKLYSSTFFYHVQDGLNCLLKSILE